MMMTCCSGKASSNLTMQKHDCGDFEEIEMNDVDILTRKFTALAWTRDERRTMRHDQDWCESAQY